MKRSAKDLEITVLQENCANYELVEDVQNIVIDFLIHNNFEKKPKIAAYTFNSLAVTNKRINALINKPEFSDNLIKNFAQRFYCSHETIARFLHTQQAKKRLALQYELKHLCMYKESPTQSLSLFRQPLTVKLNDLIQRKVDLEFIYNLGLLQRTPVMLSLDNENMLKLLLEKGANINGCNAHELTPLKLCTESPIRSQQYQNILKHPTLTINQQNKHGESVLLRCLMRRKYTPGIKFIVMIIRLLNAGADPELASNAGLTPMDAARRLADVTVLNIIQEKIDQKHALIP